MQVISIERQLATINDYWNPLIVGELNGQVVKVVKLRGEFVMHHHDHEDEMFLVVKGALVIDFGASSKTIGEGEFIVIPRGVDHKPVAAEEVHVLLFEPATTLNTGNVVNERTVASPRKITDR